jgi:hypothetical protein
LSAGFGGFLDSFLGLFFGSHEENVSALADGFEEKIASGLKLGRGFAQVDDVNPVAGIEDELLHLGVPTFGLVAKMDTGFQQFFYSNTNLHNISFG